MANYCASIKTLSHCVLGVSMPRNMKGHLPFLKTKLFSFKSFP